MARTCPAHVPVQCFDNINSDHRVSEELRVEVLDLLAAASGVLDVALRYDDWRARAHHRNPPVSIPDFLANEAVGHVRYRPNFADKVCEILRGSRAHGGVDETDIEELIKWLFGEPSNMEPPAAEYLFQLILSEYPIDNSLVWMFRTDQRDNQPLSGRDVACLPWQLGLPLARSGSPYAGLTIPANAVADARFPTFLDVVWSSLPFWRPTESARRRAGPLLHALVQATDFRLRVSPEEPELARKLEARFQQRLDIRVDILAALNQPISNTHLYWNRDLGLIMDIPNSEKPRFFSKDPKSGERQSSWPGD